MYDAPDPRGSAAITASASAICGTRFGLTKLVTSMRRMPAATSRLISSTFAAVGSSVPSLCKPSRGPTSTSSIFILGENCIQFSANHLTLPNSR